MSPEKRKNVKKTIELAKEAAQKIQEVHLRAQVLAVIVSISKENKHFDLAQLFQDIGEDKLRSETLVAIAINLAKAGFCQQAREAATLIRFDDYYWKAEAFGRIGFYSRAQKDFDLAAQVAGHISDSRLKDEVLGDIYRFSSDEAEMRFETPKVEDAHNQEKALKDLVSSLVKISEFETAHEVISGIDSAYWRARAYADMAMIIAEAIR